MTTSVAEEVANRLSQTVGIALEYPFRQFATETLPGSVCARLRRKGLTEISLRVQDQLSSRRARVKQIVTRRSILAVWSRTVRSTRRIRPTDSRCGRVLRAGRESPSAASAAHERHRRRTCAGGKRLRRGDRACGRRPRRGHAPPRPPTDLPQCGSEVPASRPPRCEQAPQRGRRASGHEVPAISAAPERQRQQRIERSSPCRPVHLRSARDVPLRR